MEPTVSEIIDHIEELRRRLIIVLFVFLITSLIIFPFSDDFLLYLLGQLQNKQEFVSFSIMEGLGVRINLTLLLSSIFSFPIFLYEIFAFISPAFKKNEKKAAIIFIPASMALFFLGVFVSYKLLFRTMLNLLLGVTTSMGITPLIGISDFITILILTCLSTGLLLQYPLVLIIMLKYGVINRKTLKEYRRHFYIITLVITAIITPDPSLVSQVVLSILLIFLYELILLFNWEKKVLAG